jgi:integrase
MAIKQRGGVFWMDVQINGTRIRESLKTDDRKLAQQAYDLRRAELWKERVVKEKPKKTFSQACQRWIEEKGHKRSINDDKAKIAALKPKLGNKLLADIDRDLIEASLPDDVKPATRNRYRALIRAILRAAEREWGWLDRAPALRTEAEPRRRVAFLSQEQAASLIACLPEKWRTPVRFTILTGLRKSNALGLTWEQVNLDAGMVIVEADEAKAGERILVPLSSQAKELLQGLPGPRQGRVWGDLPDLCTNTWRSATRRAGVPWCRFHDLRHTWASWHAMAGTPLSVLQELGGWHSSEMVRRYAHLSPEHLQQAAERVKL